MRQAENKGVKGEGEAKRWMPGLPSVWDGRAGRVVGGRQWDGGMSAPPQALTL